MKFVWVKQPELTERWIKNFFIKTVQDGFNILKKGYLELEYPRLGYSGDLFNTAS